MLKPILLSLHLHSILDTLDFATEVHQRYYDWKRCLKQWKPTSTSIQRLYPLFDGITLPWSKQYNVYYPVSKYLRAQHNKQI